jgi:hypothetical protein
MATLQQYLSDIDDDEDAFEEAEEMDMDWSFLPVEDFGDISLTTQPVDGTLLEQAKKEIKKVCQNARTLLQRPSNRSVTLSDASNYFLKAIMPGIRFIV